MDKNSMYLGTTDIYTKIRSLGGQWNDSKERPIVCLLESTEHKGLYWAIPVGNFEHRDEDKKNRILHYLAKDETNIESAYYHLGRTTVKSIFFISDVIPITDKYIEREYLGHNNQIYVIKNGKLISELTNKLTRILAFENSKPNHFRQHITDLKNFLISELEEANQ